MSLNQSINKQVNTFAYSNIALVKYWGKTGRQLPINPSISMTINQCKTFCEIEYELDEKNPGIKSFEFENKVEQSFQDRFNKYLFNISDVYPLANKMNLKVRTKNNFPHSAGIASSASAFAAFAKALVQIEETELQKSKYPNQRASFLARLGSGSAARSITDSAFTLWGKTIFDFGSDEFTTDLNLSAEQLSKIQWPLLDSVLIVDSGKKEISSSLGHSLMHTHLYKDVRVAQANENIRVIYDSILNGDIETFGEIIENEALSLHALMMTSYPSFCLLKPNSLAIIEKVKQFRKQTSLPLYFTIDAGPNIHLIYPESIDSEVSTFIKSELSDLLESVIWGRADE